MLLPPRSTALALAAQSEGSPLELRTQLRTVRTLLERSGLGALLRDRSLPAAAEKQLLATLVREAKLDAGVGSLLRILISANRLRELRSIEVALAQIALRKNGHLLTVCSALPLSPAHVERLRHAVAAHTGGDVTVETEVDPATLGGLRLELDGQTLDHTFATRLNELQATSSKLQGAIH